MKKRQTKIKGVIHKTREDAHENEKREMSIVFNGDFEGFTAAQVKLAKMKRDDMLGGHFHYYEELFYLWEGTCRFFLADIHDAGRREIINLNPGDCLMIPAEVAHAAKLSEGAILVGCTKEPYESPKKNDHNYSLDWCMGL